MSQRPCSFVRTERCRGLIVAGHLCKKSNVWADPLLTARVVLAESRNNNLSACRLRTGESVVARPEFGKTRLTYAGVHAVYQRARHKFADRRHVAWPGTFDWSVRVLRPVGNAVRLK